jgi:phosphomannomutase
LLGFKDFTVVSVDATDGLRMTLESGDIIHLRPSGNAPELRCYAESDSLDKASQIVKQTLENLKTIDVISL